MMIRDYNESVEINHNQNWPYIPDYPCRILGLVSAIFLCFTKRKHFKNYEKCFMFHLKSSFCSKNIQIFIFFPFRFTFYRFKELYE